MSKSFLRFNIAIMVIFMFNFIVYSQESDYETIENFKKKYNNLLTEIRNSNDKDFLNNAKNKITKLNTEYNEFKELINESIYPNNFISYFEKIEKERESSISRTELSHNLKSARSENILLSDKLGKLTKDYDQISNDNSLLSKQIKFLQKQSKKDKDTINKINSLLSDMRENIRKKDQLIVSMIDSLFSDFDKPKLTDVNKDQLLNIVNDNNFFGKIIFTINQNIKFLESSSHNAEDMAFAIMEYDKFVQLWNKISPNLLTTYLDLRQSTEIFEMINERYIEWKKTLEVVTWLSIFDFMNNKSIGVESFSNNNEFKNSTISYIDRQISNRNDKEIYYLFADTVWNTGVKKDWIPMLIEKEYTSESDINEIEAKIKEWESSFTNWLLYILLIIFGLILIAFVIKILLNTNKDEN